MKRTILGWFTVMLIALLAGCGENTYQPVAINEETDKCAICNMQVKDDAFAVQLTTKDGKTYKFDDLGCMNEWKEKNGTENIAAQFVRDFNDNEWVKYEDASYAYDAFFKSPMAYGIYSFKDKNSAEAYVAEQKKGKVMSANDLNAHNWERNKEMMKDMMGGEGHGSDSHSQSGGEGKKESGHGANK